MNRTIAYLTYISASIQSISVYEFLYDLVTWTSVGLIVHSHALITVINVAKSPEPSLIFLVIPKQHCCFLFKLSKVLNFWNMLFSINFYGRCYGK